MTIVSKEADVLLIDGNSAVRVPGGIRRLSHPDGHVSYKPTKVLVRFPLWDDTSPEQKRHIATRLAKCEWFQLRN